MIGSSWPKRLVNEKRIGAPGVPCLRLDDDRALRST